MRRGHAVARTVDREKPNAGAFGRLLIGTKPSRAGHPVQQDDGTAIGRAPLCIRNTTSIPQRHDLIESGRRTRSSHQDSTERARTSGGRARGTSCLEFSRGRRWPDGFRVELVRSRSRIAELRRIPPSYPARHAALDIPRNLGFAAAESKRRAGIGDGDGHGIVHGPGRVHRAVGAPRPGCHRGAPPDAFRAAAHGDPEPRVASR